MSEDKDVPTAISRRTLLGATAAAPMLCTVTERVTPQPDSSLVRRCAQWLAANFESDALTRRWGALETLAASDRAYFRMSEREVLNLPMGPEMAAIETKLDDLWKVQKRHFKAVSKMTPKNIHEAACLMVLTARIDIL